MEHFQSSYNLDGNYYYSCDYPGCKKTRNKLKHNILNMPSGWYRTVETVNGEKITRHYCREHYNRVLKIAAMNNAPNAVIPEGANGEILKGEP